MVATVFLQKRRSYPEPASPAPAAQFSHRLADQTEPVAPSDAPLPVLTASRHAERAEEPAGCREVAPILLHLD